MQKKLKECDGCNKLTIIWKNHEGFRYCKNCWSCHKSKDTELQKPTTSGISQVSSKRKKKDQEYLKLRERFLTENHLCQVVVSGCTNSATDVHHTYAGANREAFYLVQSTWKAVCRNCHDWIHAHPAEARIMNWLK
jgi:hypothetical protein